MFEVFKPPQKFTRMKMMLYVLWSVLVSVLLISCKEAASSKEPELEYKDPIHIDRSEIVKINSDSIVEILQGKWKEIAYPYRLASFNHTTVKFIEEGVVDEPSYKEFKILKACPFEVNNIVNARQQDMFLVVSEAGTCEIVKILGDTLILSGFSVNTNNDYQIVFSRVE